MEWYAEHPREDYATARAYRTALNEYMVTIGAQTMAWLEEWNGYQDWLEVNRFEDHPEMTKHQYIGLCLMKARRAA